MKFDINKFNPHKIHFTENGSSKTIVTWGQVETFRVNRDTTRVRYITYKKNFKEMEIRGAYTIIQFPKPKEGDKDFQLWNKHFDPDNYDPGVVLGAIGSVFKFLRII